MDPHRGNLVRDIREAPNYGILPYLMSRRHEYTSGSHGAGSARREPWSTHNSGGFPGDSYLKRNFDEIDLSGLNNFVKRNMDEIDHTSMPLSYVKRVYHPYGTNYLDIQESSYDKKKHIPDYLMDEIDLSQFPIGSKRSSH